MKRKLEISELIFKIVSYVSDVVKCFVQPLSAKHGLCQLTVIITGVQITAEYFKQSIYFLFLFDIIKIR